MKTKASELIGPALDWAVAKSLGWQPVYTNGALYPVFQKGGNVEKIWREYSTDWSQAGPIIEREGITVIRCDDDYGHDDDGFCNNVRIPVWAATNGHHSLYRGYDEPEASYSQYESEVMYGPTPLIAAMRCFVASKLGDEIEIPEELLT